MSGVTDRRPAVCPLLTAALLLAARPLLGRLRLPRPSASEILEATGATRSRAYELREALLDTLPELERPVGRPRTEKPAPLDTGAISREVLDFVLDHPGCVCKRAERMRYGDSFRHFVLELCERERQIPLEDLATGTRVPLGTLKDWLRGGRSAVDSPAEADSTFARKEDSTSSRVETLLTEWRHWEGSFTAFCHHVSYDLRIPYGRTLIALILEKHGERTPQRRSGRSPDEKALRGSFETFFPGAQWEGDGASPIAVEIDEQRFDFNLELMVDAYSDASVGVSIRDEEDSRAVTEAFEDGVQTTGAPPLAVLVDNRPSNHTESVDHALGSTLRMRATKGRGQNKAHVEGAFGLFSQTVPLIAITAASPKELARQILELVTQTWARTLNHRPRADRKGSSRVQIYQTETPTPEQVEQARAALAERCKKQELAQTTLKARQDPVARSILDDAFARLSLDDPEGNIRSAIARYPLEAIVSGIATFEGKRAACTLPLGVDGRYLLGIVRNIAQQDEGLQIAEALLRARLDARDRLLTPLQRSLASLLQLVADPLERLKALTDLALATDRRIDRLFWLDALGDQLRSQPASRHSALLRFAARRIHATYALHQRDRQAAVRHLFAKVIPLEN